MKTILITLFTILIGQSLHGQEDSIKFDAVTVVKEFSAEIGNFNKIGIEPKLPVFDLKSRNYEYSVRAIPMKLDYEKPQIRPLALNILSAKANNKYYLKLGYGIPKLLNAEISIGAKKENMNYNLSIDHISANDSTNLKDKRNSETNLNFQYFNRNNEMEMEYGINTFIGGSYYYLYADKANQDSLFQTSDNKRRFVKGGMNLMFKKEGLLTNMDNKTNLRYQFLQLNTDKGLENNFIIENISTYSFNRNFSFSLNLKGDFLSGSDVQILHSKPYFIYNSRLINLKLGGDIGKSQNSTFIYPYAEISSNLFSNFIEIFATVENDIYINTNYFKTSYNPFINFNEDSISTTKQNNYSAGFRSSLEGAKIEFIGSYQIFKDKLFFISSQKDKRTFASVYDNGSNIKLEANASYRILPQLEISGNVIKNFYEMDNFQKAWHTPDFTANASAKTFLLDHKLSIIGELFFASSTWYQDYDGSKKKINSLFDLSGKAKYKFLKNSHLFLEVNNIFAQKYQRWYQYPSYGINLLAGFEIGF